MTTIEIVPWLCREEWEFCRDNLFGGDVDMKQKAVSHLYIWKTRCSKLHMGVECTLVLMDTKLQDLQPDENDNRLPNRMNLEHLYSMALTKFVNFVTDSSVGNRSAYRLRDLAKELGIPDWIIELRHRAAHNSSCPSLSLLREAADFCLKWLYDEYWATANFEDVYNQEENTITYIENCLEVYLTIKNYLLDGCERVCEIANNDRQKLTRFLHRTSESADYDHFDNWNLTDVCKITIEKLSKIIKKCPRKGELLIDRLLEGNSLLDSNNIDGSGHLRKSYVYIWNDFISVLCVSSKCFHFLQSLVKISIDPMEPMIRKKCAAVHLNEVCINILKQNRTTKSNNIDCKRKLKLRRPLLLDQEASALLKLVLQQPSEFVVIYLKTLSEIQNPPIDSAKIDKLLQLMNIYNGHSTLEDIAIQNENKDLLSSITFQDEEMLESNPDKCVTNSDILGDKEESWNWNQTPIGILPWQQDFKPWLKLYGM